MPRQGYRIRSQGCKPLGYVDITYKSPTSVEPYTTDRYR